MARGPGAIEFGAEMAGEGALGSDIGREFGGFEAGGGGW